MLRIYRASAGSGKTYRLTKDYIDLLFSKETNQNYKHILAVTFTNKATHEMKSRILKELFLLAQGEKSDFRPDLMKDYNLNEAEVKIRANKILIDILYDYSSFSVSTIDKFFQQIIRSFAREIGVKSGYGVELDTDSVLQQAVDNLFFNLSEEGNKLLLRWLSNLSEERIEEGKTWDLRHDLKSLGKEIFKENFQSKAQETSKKLHDRVFLSNFRESLLNIKRGFENEVKEKAKAIERSILDKSLIFKDFKYGAMNTLEKLQNGNFDLGKRFLSYLEDAGECYSKSTPPSKIEAIESLYLEGLQSSLLELVDYIETNIISYNSSNIVLKHLSMLGVLTDLALEVKELTEEQNTILLSDSNLFLNKIIDGSDAPFVYEKSGIAIHHYMIDEFQDTSVLQWKNFKPLVDNSLASNNFNLVVGDVKQSIYRWRNSDWTLLDEKILSDFSSEQTDEETLGTNWRSDRNIIEFNNSVFTISAKLMQEKLNENMLPALSRYKNLELLKTKILHAYDKQSQEASPKAGCGYVEVNFIAKNENENGWQAESLSRLPKILEGLQDRGYSPNKIAILVRKNSEEKTISQFLLNHKSQAEAKKGYCYDVMSSGGLLLESSPSIRFILGLLRLFINPEDKIQRTIVRYEYLCNQTTDSEEDVLKKCFLPTTEKNKELSVAFPDEREELKQLHHYSIYEMVEEIINIFKLGDWKNQAVFVQSFQDVVFNFSTGKAADLNNFLNWWKQKGTKQCIPSPDGQNAFPIMTVHSAKGLDFDAVVIPFCDWKLEGGNRDILWCESSEEVFKEMPLLPVEYTKNLSQSIFAENYFKEQMSLYLDNLNVAYVAFTRAKHELICFAPLNEKANFDTISGLLSTCFKNKTAISEESTPLSTYYNEEKAQFKLGKTVVADSKETREDESKKITDYPTTKSSDRLQTRLKGFDLSLGDKQMADSRLIYGTVMHQILQEISQKEDQEDVLQRFVRKGDINSKELELVRKELDAFWAIPESAIWFDSSARVLNEATILTPEGYHYRPDRIAIKGKKAKIVDYKFGDSEKTAYKKQMQQYINLLEQMAYEVEGFICYVSLRKVIRV